MNLGQISVTAYEFRGVEEGLCAQSVVLILSVAVGRFMTQDKGSKGHNNVPKAKSKIGICTSSKQ